MSTSFSSSSLRALLRSVSMGALLACAAAAGTACSSTSTPSSSGSSGESEDGVDGAAPPVTRCSDLAVPAKAPSKGSDGKTPPPPAAGGALLDGTYALTELLSLGGPPPDVEAKAFKFTGTSYEVAKHQQVGNTLVTYTESGTFTTNGTALELTATCSCTQLGTNDPGCKTSSFPVTRFAYTATPNSLVATSTAKGTTIEIQETFAKP